MPPDSVTLRDPYGEAHDVPNADVAAYVSRGYKPEAPAEHDERVIGGIQSDLYGGVGGVLKTGAAGVLGGLTLGGTDALIGALGGRQALQGYKAENPVTSIGTNILGSVLPALATGGASAPGTATGLGKTAAGLGAKILARTPAGLATSAGNVVAKAGAGAGALVKAGYVAAGAGVEGALQGGGQYLSQVALEDKPLSAEGFVGAMGHGALFAAPIGGALSLAGSGLQRARSLFPQRVVTQEAAKAIDTEAVSAVGQAVSDGDRMAAALQQRLALTEAKASMAEAAEGTTRRMFGAADPQALDDQIAGGVERAQMTAALQRLNASRAQLADWVREEADPALEAALTGIKSPDVGQLGGRIEKLPGKFGEPELAGGTPITPANRELMDALDARGRQLDVTAVGKRPVAPDDSLEALLAGTKAQLDEGQTLGQVAGRPKLPESAPAGSTAHPTLASSANADSSLEALLAGTKSKLDGGESIKEISDGSKLRKDYVTSKQLNVGKPLTETPAALAAKESAPAAAPVLSDLADPADAGILSKYQGGQYSYINDYLRSGKVAKGSTIKGKKEAKSIVASIDNALAKAATAEDQVVYRGISSKRYTPDMKPGAIVEDAAYSSASTDRKIGIEYATKRGGTLMEVEVPKGSRAARLESDGLDESELLLPRGSKFELKSIGTETIDGVEVRVAKVRLVTDAPTVAAADDLEALLRGTKSQLDAGAAIKDVKPGAVLDDAPSFKEPQPKTTHFDIADTNMKFDPLTRTYHSAEATAASLPRSGQLADLDALLGTGAKRDVTSVLGKRALSGGAPLSSEEYAVRSSLGKRIVDSATPPPANANDSIAKILAKRPGKNADMGPSFVRAAKAIGDHESAMADVADILGAQAPSGAAANAKAYRAATAGQADAAASSAAKSADHITNKLGPQLTAATGGAPGKALGRLADIGTALEVLQTMGVHVPSAEKIPVIGPILSLFLKARAVMGIVGRKGGSVGKSVEGRIAMKSAEARNRINAAAVAALTVAAKGAKKASAISAGPAVTLANRLFPGGEEPKSRNPRELYAARMDDIARAQAPGAIANAVSDRIMTADPLLQDAIVSQVERGLKFLDSKSPKQTVMPGMVPGDGKWHPSKAAIEEWGRYVHAVNDPASVLEDLAKGHVTTEGAEVLRVVYPKLFAEAQRMLLENAAKLQVTLPYARRVAISIMYQVPVDATMTPSHMQFLQPPPPQPGAQPGAPAGPMGPPPGAPAITGPLSVGPQTMTSLDRRAGR